MPDVVSFSELQAWRTCPLRWWLAYHRRWSQPEVTGARSRGTRFHAVLDRHYREIQASQALLSRAGMTPPAGITGVGWDWSTPLAKVIAPESLEGLDGDITLGDHTLAGIWSQIQPLLSDQAGNQTEEQQLVEWAYRGYVQCYGLDKGWSVLAVEHAPQVWLPTDTGGRSNFKLKMRIDLVVRDVFSGDVWIVDHKCLAKETRIATPSGWTVAGDLQTGDSVVGSDGKPNRVTNISHREQAAYQLTLRNGKQIVASANHRWPVSFRADQANSELTTEQIADRLLDGRQVRLLPAPAVDVPAADLPLDPYLLGALLGDGTFDLRGRRVMFTKGHQPTLDRAHAALPTGDDWTLGAVSHPHVMTYQIKGRTPDIINQLGLRTHGRDKHIPAAFLGGSIEQRRALLAGWLDTDGSTRHGVAVGFTELYRLALGMQQLAESLGAVTYLWCNQSPKYTYKGESRVGAPNWELKMRFPRDAPNPFRHEEKAAKWKPSYKFGDSALQVLSVEPAGAQQLVDISVENDDELFVAAGVLTHNSSTRKPSDLALGIDDQFGLYTWGLRQLGMPVAGSIHSFSRSERLVRAMTLDERFIRTPMFRSDPELDAVAQDAWRNARDSRQALRTVSATQHKRAARGMSVVPDSNLLPTAPSSIDCKFCDYANAHLAGRKAWSDMERYLEDTGFERFHGRH